VKITKGLQTSTCKVWEVAVNGKEYQVTNYWCVGELRMSWLVEVLVSPPQVQSYWRRIKGLDLINAVREYENAATAA
jgi:hypothetical protein